MQSETTYVAFFGAWEGLLNDESEKLSTLFSSIAVHL